MIDLAKRLEMMKGVGKGSVGGRKAEVLKVLKSADTGISIKNIGEQIGISNKNVSSLLSYLRSDKYIIGDMGNGIRVLLGRNIKDKDYMWNGKEFISVDDVAADVIAGSDKDKGKAKGKQASK